jgi:hypothetical protein
MTMAQPIQINLNWDVFSKMVGDDPQVMVALAREAALRFAERHVKEVANEPAIQQAVERAEASVKFAVEDYLRRERGIFSTQSYLSRDFKQDIAAICKDAVSKEIRAQIYQAVNELVPNLKAEIEAEIIKLGKHAVRHELGKAISELVRQMTAVAFNKSDAKQELTDG